MVLADTSVWINHFRKGDNKLAALLVEGKVAIHEFIICELACGKFKNYDEIIYFLKNLPQAKKVTFDEYLIFLKNNKLNHKGIGFVDVHLLASSKLSVYPLFTYDKKLSVAAKELGLSFL